MNKSVKLSCFKVPVEVEQLFILFLGLVSIAEYD